MISYCIHVIAKYNLECSNLNCNQIFFTTVLQGLVLFTDDIQDRVQKVEQLLQEALVMHGFRHPNVLSLLNITFKDDVPYIITPYMHLGDLKKYIKNNVSYMYIILRIN